MNARRGFRLVTMTMAIIAMLPLAFVLASTTNAAAVQTPAPDWWRPAATSSWQIQLTGELALDVDVDAYVIDLFDTPAETIRALHDAGRRVICYLSAGSQEDWRSDAAEVPESAIGEPLDDWPGEYWLDLRANEVRLRLEARFDLAVEKGCDGVDPDNVDGYSNSTGFPLTARDQLAFNRFLADAAHARGLAIGLKNDLEQIEELVDDFNWALNEECFQYDECGELASFVAAEKPVFQIEYGPPSLAGLICPLANAVGFVTLIKNLSLDAERTPCRE